MGEKVKDSLFFWEKEGGKCEPFLVYMYVRNGAR